MILIHVPFYHIYNKRMVYLLQNTSLRQDMINLFHSQNFIFFQYLQCIVFLCLSVLAQSNSSEGACAKCLTHLKIR